MVYIPDRETWYCVECQEKGLIYNLSKGSEEDRFQHNYINWYLEQKERFTKRFLGKERPDLEKRIHDFSEKSNLLRDRLKTLNLLF